MALPDWLSTVTSAANAIWFVKILAPARPLSPFSIDICNVPPVIFREDSPKAHLDKFTGAEIWKHERATDAYSESLQSYATPFVYRFDGLEFLIILGADYVTAHSLKDGSELWRCGGLQNADRYSRSLRIIASPVAVPGLVVVPSAKNGPILGLNPLHAAGDITNTAARYGRTNAAATSFARVTA